MKHLLTFPIRSFGRRLVVTLLLAMSLVMPFLAAAQEGASEDTGQPPVLPGVPVSVEVSAFSRVALTAGDYRWQATSLPAFPDDSVKIAVHRGFVVAVNNPVAILREDGTIWQADRGSALAIAEGEQFAAAEVNGEPADMTIVELPLVSEVKPDEQPDQVAPFTLAEGMYILAVLAIPAHKEGDPTPGQLLAQAAGPGIAVYPRAVGQATPAAADKSGPFWLVAIFPDTGAASTPGA